MSKRQKKRRFRRGVLTLTCVLLVTAIVAAVVWAKTPTDGLPRGLYSRNVLLVRVSDGESILSRRADERIYPASLTKMMTVFVALQSIEDIGAAVLLDDGDFEGLVEQDAVQAGFLPGEEVPAIDLMYGALLPSGAECCVALARYAAGDEEAFVEKMNEKAAELGMTGTHFTGVIGLHDDSHYTTARDMATLLRAALQNETFFEIFTSTRHSTKPTNLHPDGITVRSSFFEKAEETEFPGISRWAAAGGKTGYTSQAGLCLASLAEKDGEQYILITAGADGSTRTAPHHIEDAVAVFRGAEIPEH